MKCEERKKKGKMKEMWREKRKIRIKKEMVNKISEWRWRYLKYKIKISEHVIWMQEFWMG